MMFPKGPPRAELKEQRRRLKAAIERKEDKKVRDRSGWRCEHVYAVGLRCPSPAVHVHHKLKGRGVRGVGDSALAKNKEHLCYQHHQVRHGLMR